MPVFLHQKECEEDELNKYSELKEDYYREFCKNDPATFHLVAGAHELFNTLKAHGIPFTIASASIKPNIDFYVESFELEKWFDPAKIIYDDGTYANKKAMFLDAAMVIGVQMEDCIVFEDSESGIRDAYAVGCRNIVVLDSMGVAKEKHGGKPGIIAIETDLVKLAESICD